MKAKDVYTEKYINYFKDTLTRLMATPSPSGYFREVNALLTELAQKENARCTVSPKGTCEIFIQGKGKETRFLPSLPAYRSAPTVPPSLSLCLE